MEATKRDNVSKERISKQLNVAERVSKIRAVIT